MATERSRIVVICPVYNEQDNVGYFFDRISRVFDSVDSSRYECHLLFTNNRSIDDTVGRILELERKHDWVHHLTLSRNFGYQLSVLSGLTVADADLFMVCDVDCEDPPELLLDFLREIEKGSDIVYGIRSNRPDTWFMRTCRSAFYYTLCRIGDYTMIPYMAEFAMFRRAVRDVIIANANSFPFIRAEIGYAGFTIVGVPYRRAARRHGKTHYNYMANVRFAVSGLLSSTTFPLRAMLYSLPGVVGANLLMAGLFAGGGVAFETTVVGLMALNGIYATTSLACVGIYVARTYQNGLFRRRFIIDESRSAIGSVRAAGQG